MKKFQQAFMMAIILILMLVMAILPAHAAGETMSVSPVPAEVSRNGTVTITVSISGAKNVRGISVEPKYDDVFTLKSGAWAISGQLMDFSMKEENGVICFDTVRDIDGEIFSFTLGVKGDAAFEAAQAGCDVSISVESSSEDSGTADGSDSDSGLINLSATCTVQIVCNHNFSQQNTDYLSQPASCVSKALYYYSCKHCGAKGTETFEYGQPLSHTYDKTNTDSAYLKSGATCTAPAVYYYSCTCGDKGTTTFESGSTLGHNHKTTWSSDNSSHWHECSRCADKKDEAAHIPGAAATEAAPQTCTECGYVISPALGHTHSYGTEWKKDGTNHYHECSCGAKGDVTAHTPGDWIVDKQPAVGAVGSKHRECTVCGQIVETATIEAVTEVVTDTTAPSDTSTAPSTDTTAAPTDTSTAPSTDTTTAPTADTSTAPEADTTTAPSTNAPNDPSDPAGMDTIKLVVIIVVVLVVGAVITVLVIVIRKRY